MNTDCQSCKDERATKKPSLPPMERVQLPPGVTDNDNFRKPHAPVYVCPYCDGETLIATARASYIKRQEAE